MFKVNFKFMWTIVLTVISLGLTAQDCPTEVALTDVTGNPCRRIDLTLEVDGATSYQWYKDDVLLAGEDESEIEIHKFAPLGDGTYHVYVETPNGCVASEPYLVMKDEFFTDLGEISLCDGDTLFLGGFAFFTPGFQRFKTSTAEGCDSTIQFNINIVNPTRMFEYGSVCIGGTYTGPHGRITATSTTEFTGPNGVVIPAVAGEFIDTLKAVGGCDSLEVIHKVEFAPLDPIIMNPVICAGSTYEFKDITATSAGPYQTIVTDANGCDSVFMIELVVLPPLEETIDEEICQGKIYTLGDISANETGQYQTTLKTAEGCDSIVTVNLAVVPADPQIQEETICKGNVFEWRGMTYDEAGEYTDAVSIPGECDEVHILQLEVTQGDVVTIEESTCEGIPFEWRGNSYDEAGTYSEEVQDAAGCDFTEILELTIIDPETVNIEETICEGQEFEWRGNTYTDAGDFSETVVEAGECTFVEVLTLNVTPPFVVDVAEEICEGTGIEWRGTTYTEAGTYSEDVQDAAGCNFTEVLTLTVTPPATVLVEETICQGQEIEWRGTVYTEAGDYSEMIVEAGECTFEEVLTLTVEAPVPTIIEEEICEGTTFEWRGQEYDTAGEYTVEDKDAAGCDIIETLNLTVTPPPSVPVEETICSGAEYEWRGEMYNEAGEYSELVEGPGECSFVEVLTLTVDDPEVFNVEASTCVGVPYEWRGQTYDEAGSYEQLVTDEGSCHFMEVLTLTVEAPETRYVEETICQGLSYEWRGNTFNESGEYDLAIEEDGTCTFIEVLRLTVTAPEVTYLEETICFGETYEGFGIEAKDTGTHTSEVETPGECTVAYELELTVLPKAEGAVEAVLCSGDTYTLYDLTTDVAGTFTATTQTAFGCDSTITVLLLAATMDPVQVNEEICKGESVMFEGEEYSTAGQHTAILVSSDGCDSIRILDLVVNNAIDVFNQETICEGDMYERHTIAATESGTYTAEVTNAIGCDSMITVELVVLEKSYNNFSAQICAGETFEYGGLSETEPGTYETIIANKAGCDSIVTIDLDVYVDEPTSYSTTICEGDTYILGDVVADEAGRYQTVLNSKSNCDSTVVIDLQVLPLDEREQLVEICPGDVITFYGREISEPGTYTERVSNAAGSCDSVITLMLDFDATLGEVEIEDSFIVNTGASIDITPVYIDEGFIAFRWEDADGDIISIEQDLMGYTPADDTYVDFYATTPAGCEVHERVRLDVELVVELYIPNVISPDLGNSDSYFTVGGNESVIGIQELHIFDRWGEEMFTDSHEGRLDTYLGWDGTFKGKKVQPAVFTYLVIFEIIDGSTVKKGGSVTVLN